jgi:1-aminocyclopropane-1-carboxylate deaminase/D-cysteine desulfhydrase-like pyridoxal-dependent ACC family enzyme
VLGAAEVGFDVVVVVPVVVVEVVSVLPGTVVAVTGCCGTKALIVRTASTCGKVDCAGVPAVGVPVELEHDVAGTSQNAMSLTLKRRPDAMR